MADTGDIQQVHHEMLPSLGDRVSKATCHAGAPCGRLLGLSEPCGCLSTFEQLGAGGLLSESEDDLETSLKGEDIDRNLPQRVLPPSLPARHGGGVGLIGSQEPHPGCVPVWVSPRPPFLLTCFS